MMHDDPYGLGRWGDDLFEVLDNGDLGLRNPERPDLPAVSLPSIVRDLDQRGVVAPVLIRFAPFLHSRIDTLNESFGRAIGETGYGGTYQSIYPVKVNQQADVIDRIVEHGASWNLGLEVGSKPELLIALSRDLSDGSLIVCNGVKDDDFVQLAISAQNIGVSCVIVLESLGELDVVLRVAERLGERPLLGVRIKLTQKSSGSWASSSGDRSAFGVGASDLMVIVERLREAGMLDCLELQHSHIGSQIPNVNEIRSATSEAARFFVALRQQGAPLSYFDLGGGLGVDYTGEHRSAAHSTNYTLSEYCVNVVETVEYVLDAAGESHPTLITESGRAIVASSSILVFDVLEATYYDRTERIEHQPDDHPLLKNLIHIHDYIDVDRLQECVSDAEYYRNELRQNFRRGLLSLEQLARSEEGFLTVIRRLKQLARTADSVDEGVEKLLAQHVDIYHGNLSVFQSLPDTWAIDQIHPVLPIQRLDEAPTRRAIVSDTTCDSDGKIDRFVTAHGVSESLPVHDLVPGERYHLGVFLVGAYQETLGDLHNLFGDTNVVTVGLLENGDFELLAETEGDTIAEVLSYVEYDPRVCLDSFKKRVDAAVDAGRIDAAGRRTLISTFRHSLSSYTYFEH